VDGISCCDHGRAGETKNQLGTLFKVLGFAYLTFVSARSIAVFAIIAAPVLRNGRTGIENIKTDLAIHFRYECGPLYRKKQIWF